MSETKKVLSREFAKEFESQGKKMYSFKVKFEGDDRTFQYVSTIKDNPPHFTVGEQAEFTITEQKYEKDGATTIYYKCVPVKPAFTPGGKGFAKKGKAEYSCEALQFSTSYVKDLIIAGKVELKDWTTKVDEIMKYNERKIAEYLKPE